MKAFIASIDLPEPYNSSLSSIQFTSEARFEWVDGPLVRAMLLGHWLVLDNVNLCSPSVLDRLNAMFEAGGVLNIPEQGTECEDDSRTDQATSQFQIINDCQSKFGG